MAHYDLEEQEQLDAIKTWWKMYGNLVTGVVAAIAIAVVGWQGWNWYQNRQAAQASAIFTALEEAISAKDNGRIKAISGELTEKFSGTSYAALGAMAAAKASFDAGDLKTAKLQLSWVAENAKGELRDMTRLRLAAVLLDDKAYDAALKQLESPHDATFDVRFNELKGEVLVAQGKKDAARDAFKAALTRFDEKAKAEKPAGAGKDSLPNEADLMRGPYRELLQQKIDALGEKA